MVMGRERLVKELFVYMNNQLVGTLWKERTGSLSFAYDLKWLESKDARPISLSMSLQEASYKGEVVYNYFDNLLPDNELLKTRIQKRFK